jgi:glycosyltransferase involved in cell wall biosynthesis
MAVGTAVVATAVGGTGEIIEDGRNGLLVPPREVDRWVGALAPLLDDPGARERLGQAGKERARDFAVCRHVEAVLDVYAEVASDAA